MYAVPDSWRIRSCVDPADAGMVQPLPCSVPPGGERADAQLTDLAALDVVVVTAVGVEDVGALTGEPQHGPQQRQAVLRGLVGPARQQGLTYQTQVQSATSSQSYAPGSVQRVT